MNLHLTPHQARLLRLRSQGLLSPPSVSPAQAASDVCGIQAQDLTAAQLSIRARSSGLTAVDVEHARLAERSLAWIWCLRGTLHLIPAGDARWLGPLLGPSLSPLTGAGWPGWAGMKRLPERESGWSTRRSKRTAR